MSTAARNPGPVEEWLFALDGSIAGLGQHSGTLTLFLPDGAKKWQPVAALGGRPSDHRFHAYDAARGFLYASRLDKAARFALQRFDIAQREWQILYAHPRYDVAPPVPRGNRDNPRGVVLSPADASVLGVSYAGPAPLQSWLDPTLAAAQLAIDAALPQRANRCLGIDRQRAQTLWLSTSDRDPGTYYLMDLRGTEVLRLASRAPWLNEADLAQSFPVTIPTPDGLALPAFVTRMAADQPPAPLVLLLRPAVWRSTEWSFDPLAQFFATRGYAVLQVNYRGSTGYGRDFAAQGMPGLLGKIQHDLLTAVRWAVENKIADPKALAVLGRGFGAYLALDLVQREPALFSAAVAIDPLVDWRPVAQKKPSALRSYWVESPQFGLGAELPQAHAAAMTRAVAPAKLAARLLLFALEHEISNPPGSVAAYAKEMRRAGTTVDFVPHRRAPADTRAEDRYIQTILEHAERFLRPHQK